MTSDERARRVGRNDVVFREVHEQIESLNRAMVAIGVQTMHIACECADGACIERLVVELPDYQRIRSDVTRFMVAPAHELADVEDVVEKTDAFNVVRKHECGPARLATPG